MTYSNDQLERLLFEAGKAVDWPVGGDVVTAVMGAIETGSQPTRRRRFRLLPAFTVVLVVVVASLLLSPTMRKALADFFTVAGIRIERLLDLGAPPGTDLDLGVESSIHEARGMVSFGITQPVGTDLPPPDAVYVSDLPLGGMVTLVWEPSASLPEVFDTGVGLLIGQFLGRIDEEFFLKSVGPGTTVTPVDVSGNRGFFIQGAPHNFVYVDSAGHAQEETLRLAANVLLWENHGLTYRVESNLDLQATLAIAESLK